MTKKRGVSGICRVVVWSLLSILVLKFLLDINYRNQLPVKPDMTGIIPSHKRQISYASVKATLNPGSGNLGNLGMVYQSSGFYDEASQCYKLAIKKNKRRWIWSYYLGYLNLENGEAKASQSCFNSVLERDPHNLMAMFYSGESSQKLGSDEDAETVFRKILSSADDNTHSSGKTSGTFFPLQTYAKFRLARIYMNSQRIDSAELLLKNIIGDQVAFGPAYRLLGNVYRLKGDSVLSKRYLIRAGDLAEYTPPEDDLADRISLISRSDTYVLKKIDDAISIGNSTLALQLADNSMRYMPDNKMLVSRAITVYFMNELNDKALALMDRHLQYFSDDFNELFSMASLLAKQGYDALAMRYFEIAKQLEPENSRLVFLLLDLGKSREAVVLLNTLLERDPENTIILTDAVKLIIRLGNTEMANKYLGRLIKISPSNLDAIKLSGVIAEQEGRKGDALSIYEKAYLADQADMETIRVLAELYIKMERWDDALAHFNSALNIYPNEPILLEAIGKLLIFCPDTTKVNLTEGIEYSERALLNFRSSNHIRVSAAKNIATAYAELGDTQRAAKYINITLQKAEEGNIPADNYTQFFNVLREKYRF